MNVPIPKIPEDNNFHDLMVYYSSMSKLYKCFIDGKFVYFFSPGIFPVIWRIKKTKTL
jgi:hypothetical protein